MRLPALLALGARAAHRPITAITQGIHRWAFTSDSLGFCYLLQFKRYALALPNDRRVRRIPLTIRSIRGR